MPLKVITALNNWLIKPTFIMIQSHYTNVPSHFKTNVNFHRQNILAYDEERENNNNNERKINEGISIAKELLRKCTLLYFPLQNICCNISWACLIIKGHYFGKEIQNFIHSMFLSATF